MINNQKDNLFVLVKSLSKSEKRQFKLYVGRLGVNTDSKFLALFNMLDKLNKYNEVEILSEIKNCTKLKPNKIEISEFGNGNSNSLFLHLLKSNKIWKVNCQKQFQDL